MEVVNVKALHIIFVVSWFAGLFYIVRLFIYHVEADQKPENERQILQDQFKIMEKRLWYIITWPAAILTMLSGLYLVYAFNYWSMPWMQIKFGLVLGLFIYQVLCHRIFNQLQNDSVNWTSTQLRLWNEVATLFLFAIVFVVVVGRVSLENWYWGVIGLIAFGIAMMLAVKLYKKVRDKN